jgi:hypothetical protein
MQLISGWALIFNFLLIAVISGGYFYLISKNLIVSVLVGIVAAIPGVLIIVYGNLKMSRFMENIRELSTYSSQMTFNLSLGKNVSESLIATKQFVNKTIAREIDKTLKTLNEKGILDFDHFKRYNFTPLNIFNDKLVIKYERGGDTSTMFERSNEDIANAISEYDRLVRGKKSKAFQIYVVVGVIYAMPLILSRVVDGIYPQFLNYGLAHVILVLFFFGLYGILLGLEKHKTKYNILS